MKTALVSTLVASLIAGLVQFCLIPVYVGWMGIEAWGIIGFQLGLMGLLLVFDGGIATTLNRALATGSGDRQSAHQLFRVLEAIYLGEGVVFALVLVLSASWLSVSWLSPAVLPREVVKVALWAMAGAVAGQWMCGLYQAGLMGLERFWQASVIRIVGTIIGHGGNVVVLVATNGSLVGFLAWQSVFLIALACVYRVVFVRVLPPTYGPRRWGVLAEHWRFATGMGVIGITAVLITNLDKLALSRLLSLEQFGHYSLAFAMVSGLQMIVMPIYNITFPRFSALVQGGDQQAIATCYHQRSQLMAWLVLPTAAVVGCAAEPLLFVWTGKPELAATIVPLVTLAVLGTAANGMMHVPFALQMAHGRTGLGVGLNLFMLVILVPGLFVAVSRWGTVGGAAMWAVCNLLYLLVGLPITLRLLLPGEGWRWCVSVLPTALAAIALPAAFALWHPPLVGSRWGQALVLGALGLSALAVSSWFARRLFPQGPFVALASFLRHRAA